MFDATEWGGGAIPIGSLPYPHIHALTIIS